jgi:hypothetical protein
LKFYSIGWDQIKLSVFDYKGKSGDDLEECIGIQKQRGIARLSLSIVQARRE